MSGERPHGFEPDQSVEAIPALVQAMKSGHEYVQRTAADALRQIDDVRAIPRLIQALQDEHETIRTIAAGNLIRIGDAQAVPQLIPVLNYGNWRIRQVAAEILGQLAYTVQDRKILRQTARALWWRLTDKDELRKRRFPRWIRQPISCQCLM